MVALKQTLLALTLFSSVIALPSDWRLEVKDGDVSNPSPPATADDATPPTADSEATPQSSTSTDSQTPSTPEKLSSQTGGALSDFAKNHLSIVLLGSMSITYITLL